MAHSEDLKSSLDGATSVLVHRVVYDITFQLVVDGVDEVTWEVLLSEWFLIITQSLGKIHNLGIQLLHDLYDVVSK